MTLITGDQAKKIADGIKSTGFAVQNYGGGSGETYHYNTRGVGQGTTLNATNTPSNNLLTKISSIGKTVGRIAVAGGKAGAGFVNNHIVQPVNREVNFFTTSPIKLKLASDLNHNLDQQQQNVTEAYRSGKMSKENYTLAMGKISEGYARVNKDLVKPVQDYTPEKFKADSLDNAMTALAVFTGGGSEAANFGARVAGISGKDLVQSYAARGGEAGVEQLTKLGGKRGISAFANTGGRDVLKTMITESSTNLEKAVLKIPGVQRIVTDSLTRTLRREAQQQLIGETTAQFVQREAKSLATALLIKDPIVYHLNIDSGKHIYEELTTGKYGAAAVNAGLQALQIFDGPIKAVSTALSKAGGKLRDLSYGKGSYIDTLSQNIGTGHPAQVAELVQSGAQITSRSGKTSMSAEQVFRLMQENNLLRAGEDANQAVEFTLENYKRAGDLAKLTPELIAKDFLSHQEAVDAVKRLVGKKIAGLSPEQIQNLVVVRWDSIMKRSVANAMREAGDDVQALTGTLEKFKQDAGNGWVNNPTLVKQIERYIKESGSAEEVARKIESIPTAFSIPSGIPVKVAKDLAKLGYGVAVPQGGKRLSAYVTDANDTRKLISGATSPEGTDLFDAAIAPQPQLAALAGFMNKVGLSPQATQQKAYEALSKAVADKLNQLDVGPQLGFHGANGSEVTGGQVILSKLQEWVDSRAPNKLLATVSGTFGKARPGITDIRQMTLRDIREALNEGNKGVKISDADAKAIRSAVLDGYTKVPLELRGAGDKLMDYVYKYNPAQKYYSRAQSALRYSYNPFFQWQEAVETSLFSGAQGGNKISALVDHHLAWGKTKADLDATVTKLEAGGVFGSRTAGEGLFSSSLAGEAAQDVTLGRLTADITRGQKRDLAGLAESIAKSQGRTVEDLMQNNPEQIADALRVVVQYPRHGGLASPLARTLNLAFFPMRYNLKVTKLAADILSKQPPAIQFATIHSLLQLKDYFNSDEGIRWRAENADALQVFNWISPLGNISSMFKTLGFFKDKITGEQDQGIGALGQLGGLPFGVISQILDGMGIININSPYVDPKTGNAIPNYIPESTKAKAATAIQNLLGSVFTYPGQTLGLPGKTAMLRNLTSKFIDTKGGYLIQQYTQKNKDGSISLTPLGEQSLTKSQKNLILVLAGDHSEEAVDRLYMDENGRATLPPSVLPFNIPEERPVMTKTERLQAKADAKAAAKAAKVKPTAKPVGTY